MFILCLDVPGFASTTDSASVPKFARDVIYLRLFKLFHAFYASGAILVFIAFKCTKFKRLQITISDAYLSSMLCSEFDLPALQLLHAACGVANIKI